jgi:hypothetical protein
VKPATEEVEGSAGRQISPGPQVLGAARNIFLGEIFPRKRQDICLLGKVPKFGMKN